MEVLAAAEATAPELAGLRLDAALLLLFPDRWQSSTALKNTVRRGEILINGKASRRPDTPLQLGDQVSVVTRMGCAAASAPFHRQTLRRMLPGLDVAYEDEHMAVVVKPQGLLSVGPKGASSVAGRIKYCLQPTALPGALKAPVIVHRLDVGTGGLMMAGKTRAAAAALTQDLADHRIQKRYLALVLGRLTGSGVIDHPVGGFPAVSLFRVEGHRPSASCGCLTLVSLWPRTGRTHQLRKHMAYIGHPILGDLTYKHHRKPDCQVTAAAGGLQAWLPQLGQSSQQQQMELQLLWQLQPLSPAQKQQEQQGRPALPVPQHDGVTPSQQQQQPQQQGELQPPAPPQHAAQQIQQSVRPGGVQQVTVALLDLAVYAGGNAYHQSKTTAAAAAGSSSSAGSSSTDWDAAAAPSGTGTASESGDESDVESEAAGSGSAKQRGEVLQDGTIVGTCLWAVQLQLQHPDSGAVIDIALDASVVQLFERICDLDAPSGHM